MMGDWIEWDVVQPEVRGRLVVAERGEVGSGGGQRPATIDDLKRACEAVGLHVVDRGVFDAIVAKGEANRVEADGLRASVEMQMRNLTGAREVLDPLNNANRTGIVDLARDVRKALESEGTRRAAIESENATLRAQLDELSAEHRSMVAASLRELEVLRGQLAEASKARLTCLCRDGVEWAVDCPLHGVPALTSTEGRATDEELTSAWSTHGDWQVSRRAIYDLGVAYGRRERPACLVERLVAAGYDFEVEEEDGGYWTVATRSAATPVSYRTKAEAVPTAEVPATLARLAGLDGGR